MVEILALGATFVVLSVVVALLLPLQKTKQHSVTICPLQQNSDAPLSSVVRYAKMVEYSEE